MELVCDNCRQRFNLTMKYRRDGKLEIGYLPCAACGREYIVSVKDRPLIRSIRQFRHRFNAMAKAMAAGKTIPEAETKAVQTMLDENKRRGVELRDEYLRRKSNDKNDNRGTLVHLPEEGQGAL